MTGVTADDLKGGAGGLENWDELVDTAYAKYEDDLGDTVEEEEEQNMGDS